MIRSRFAAPLLAALLLSAPLAAQQDGEPLPLEEFGIEELPALPVTPEALQPESSVNSETAGAVASAPGAVLRGLDRVTGQTTDVTLANGQTQPVFRLEVSLTDCRYPVNDPSSDAFAHLTIRDRGEVVFNGWMTAASPALSALDHPRYDVWVLGCSEG
ncbi:hypothetical protein FALB51S_02919 [Frigidibacter albus]